MDRKLSIADLARNLSNSQNIIQHDTEQFVRLFFETLQENLLSDKLVKIKGLGTFKIIEVADRDSVNVNTGERIRIQGHAKVSFTPDPELRDKVNKPFAAFETIILNEGTDVAEMERIPSEEIETEEPTDQLTPEPVVESVAALKTETVTEPVQEQEPLSEPVQEPTPEPEPEPAPQPEPAQEPAPEPEPEPAKEPEPEPVQEPAPEPVSAPVPEPKQPSHEEEGIQWRYIICFFLILALMVGSYFAGYYRILCPCGCDEEPVPAEVVKEATKPTPVKKSEKAVEATKTAAKTAKPAAKLEKKENIQQIAKKYPQVPGGKYLIVGTKSTHKMEIGDNLYKIARKEYGDKDFVRYIIVHNQFQNPDCIPLGYEVKLPDLKENK